MGKIFYLMGKSASGKDTVYKMLLQNPILRLKPVVLYTTRPIRDGETNGIEYYFTDVKQLEILRTEGKVIEERAYQTVMGVWYYFTVNDTQFSSPSPLLMIGTLESYQNTRKYFGEERVIPIYIEVEDGIRLERALLRERIQALPNYEEMCRRFLADQKDFSTKQLEASGIICHYQNIDLDTCIKQISDMIQSFENLEKTDFSIIIS